MFREERQAAQARVAAGRAIGLDFEDSSQLGVAVIIQAHREPAWR